MLEVILNSLIIQIIYLIVITFFTAFIFQFTSKIFLKTIRYNKLIFLPTGFIGIVIHELSHLILAIIFGHSIESVSLFNVERDSLNGVVVSSYNRRSFYQKLGRYFVGIGPTIIGFWTIFLILNYLHPNILFNLSNIQFGDLNLEGIKDILLLNFNSFINLSIRFDVLGILLYLFIFSIALYSALSFEDILVALGGIIYLIILLIIKNSILFFVNYSFLENLNNFFLQIAFIQVTIVLMICFLVNMLSFLLYLIRLIFHL